MHTLILKLLIDIVLLIVHNLLSNLLPILQQNFAYQDVQHFPVYMDKGKILDVWVSAFLLILLILTQEDAN